MQQQSIVNLWDSIDSFLEGSKHNLQSIKTENPFPVSARTISSIKKTAIENDGKGYQKAKLIKLCKMLKTPYKVDGSTLIINKSKKTAKTPRVCTGFNHQPFISCGK